MFNLTSIDSGIKLAEIAILYWKMPIECPQSPVHNTNVWQKLQTKHAAKTYHFGSPKLRDMLREKCRIRIREARQNSFSQGRRLCVENNQHDVISLDQILRQELAELEQDINLQEKIYRELVNEVDEWFVEQLEEEEFYLINSAESTELLCPICQKASLNCQQNRMFDCICGTSFSGPSNIDDLRQSLRSYVDAHEKYCVAPLTFFVEPVKSGVDNLAAICTNCDYFCSL